MLLKQIAVLRYERGRMLPTELEGIVVELEKVSERCQLGVDVKEVKEYINDLPEISRDIEACLKAMSQLGAQDSDSTLDVLIRLHIRLGNYANRVEEIDELVKKVISCYAQDEE